MGKKMENNMEAGIIYGLHTTAKFRVLGRLSAKVCARLGQCGCGGLAGPKVFLGAHALT